MIPEWLERTELLFGTEGLLTLTNKKVMVVGLGGVGSFAAEFLGRSGIGEMIIIDGDIVDKTNINRQLPALHSTIGISKAKLMEQRLREIHPQIRLTALERFLNPEDMNELLEEYRPDCILDCIDSLSPKIELIKAAKRKKIKLISAMGAGGKSDPSQVMVRDISKTRNCYLAKQIRKRLKKENIHKGFRCVFSTELQKPHSLKMTDGTGFKKSFYGTASYMPALFGLYAAAECIKTLLSQSTHDC